jgi:hypothetical protein
MNLTLEQALEASTALEEKIASMPQGQERDALHMRKALVDCHAFEIAKAACFDFLPVDGEKTAALQHDLTATLLIDDNLTKKMASADAAELPDLREIFLMNREHGCRIMKELRQ